MNKISIKNLSLTTVASLLGLRAYVVIRILIGGLALLLSQIALIISLIDAGVLLLLLYSWSSHKRRKLSAIATLAYAALFVVAEFTIFRPFNISITNLLYIILIVVSGYSLAKIS